ncbi:MAG: tetratricopeptide repeat protein [Planctomycetota bacterium]|jgi:tetratricopeptide (TPR) repeat protein|nr:tetratricopeptide repeat protein [Planctomycetota bacterium]MDP6988738.1 tetratricopeptide repeat protein [Planctomycetota bacterium]
MLTDLLCALALAAPSPQPPPPGAGQGEGELEALLAAERAEADRLRRRGDLRRAGRILAEHLRDEPSDAASRLLRGRLARERSDHEAALEDLRRALADAAGDSGAGEAACARELADLLLELGRAEEATAVLARARASLSPATDSRDAWIEARVQGASGRREAARSTLRQGADAGASGWTSLLARARCQRALGRLEKAQRSLVAADRAAREGEGVEPDVLVELGSVYFEADREVDEAKGRSAADLYDEALELHPTCEGALLGLFELHRTNWRRTSEPAAHWLAKALKARPDSVAALLAGLSADLDDGRLRSARARLGRLESLAPRRRDVRAERAALAWIEHRREECGALLEELAGEDAHDSAPERELGRHLVELYRFAEAIGFLRRAVARDGTDHVAWTYLGRALANTGDVDGGLEALARAKAQAGLRQDAWRANTTRVLERTERVARVDTYGELSFVWQPDGAGVLEVYLVPFYRSARAELAERYGHTPGPVRIEVFRRHQDFSVRSTGFEGFPALGVCFGPVVTALSPLCEMRGRFSWARTSFHEFTHVIHLGLSHNRCPRWITEGLATWEEAQKNPAWARNMRRELVDARYNGTIIPVRELNRAFRGPRILFGYYQGGLICEMLVERHGFATTVRLLEAFDRGLDLDGALDEVFGITPEALDADLAAFVAEKTASLAIEPRWAGDVLGRLRLGLEREPPEEPARLERWIEGWCAVAWGHWQAGRRVDAEQALRAVHQADRRVPRALFLRGELALADGDEVAAREAWEAGLAAGGEDFRVRIALGAVCQAAGEAEAAEEHLSAAERAFPGFDDRKLAAELRLAALYTAQGRGDEAMAARERYLRYDAADLPTRRRVADWHMENERPERAAALYREANEVDPFVRGLHLDWGLALHACGRWSEALREFEVAALVPPELDLDSPGPLSDAGRANLLGWQALCLVELDRDEEAARLGARALALDPDCAPALEAAGRGGR